MPKSNAVESELRYLFVIGNLSVLNYSYKFRVSLSLFYLVSGRILVLSMNCLFVYFI